MNKRLDQFSGYRPDSPQEKVDFLISEEGKILSGPSGAGAESPDYFNESPDQDLRIVPGLIDVHVHGGKGVTFGENPAHLKEELQEYSAWVVSTGVTGFLCSLAAPDAGQLLDLVRAYAEALENELPGAECLGFHLEGPFISPAKHGAFAPSWLREPAVAEAEALLQAGRGWIRQITMAPELAGAEAVAHAFRQAGVIVAMGHTDCDYEGAARALSGEFCHVTHTYNAMGAFGHRSPGAVGAILDSGGATAELIADGVHVHPGAMRLLYRCVGPDRIVLITDAMAGAGMPDGLYELVDAPVLVKDGAATRPEDGRLAGSVATLNRCVGNMVRMAGAPFAQAVRMASLNPARLLGCEDRLGSLRPGRDANFVLVDANLRVYRAVVRGKVVYEGIPD